MSETKLFNFRLSIELMDAVKAKAGKTSMTDVVTSLLADWLAPVARAPATTVADDPRILELGALVDAQRELRLKAEADRDTWRKLAQAVASNAEGRRPARGPDPMGRTQHPSGPVKASAVPDGLTDAVQTFFRPGTVEKANKSGR